MDQFPPDAEGCERRGVDSLIEGVLNGVGDASVKSVEDFRVDEDDLGVLARQYLEEVLAREYNGVAYPGYWFGSSTMKNADYAMWRLHDIERILGEDVLVKALAPVVEEWRRSFDEARDLLATPVKCEKCGGEFYRGDLYPVTCVVCRKCLDR